MQKWWLTRAFVVSTQRSIRIVTILRMEWHLLKHCIAQTHPYPSKEGINHKALQIDQFPSSEGAGVGSACGLK